MKKVLAGCVLCRDCSNKVSPKTIGVLTASDMTVLEYSGCALDNNNRLVVADRKCADYRGVKK